MSGIACIYNLDGRPADPMMIRRMSAASEYRGPDGIRHWNEGPVALASLAFWTTPEAVREIQPLSDETNTLFLIMDGRVDNRADLEAALASKGAVLRTDSDAELVLRAYQCWGEECPERIIGDFAFLIWNRHTAHLFCARDILGIKPFYYYEDARSFVCASELHQLFESPQVPKEPNEGMIGEYLAASVTNREETLYRGIKRLPPAHCLSVQPGRIRRQQYWTVDPTKELRYRRDDDYADHFRELFAETVRCRLRSYGRIGSDLSGGLDSSSVVSMVQHLSEEGKFQGDGFETFSMVFPGKACDERRYIDAVVRRWDLRTNYYEPSEREASCCLEQVRQYKDFPDYPNGMMSYPLRALARENGFRVVLSGDGGDQWLDGRQYYYADLLRELKLLTLCRQIHSDSPIASPRAYVRAFLKDGLTPLLPAWARSRVWNNSVPDYVNGDFAHGICLADRLKKGARKCRFRSLAQYEIFEMLSNGMEAHAKEMGDRALSRLQIEQRHPLADRRIIDFAVALPGEQRRRQGQHRFILRQAMRGLLPEVVRNRADKADFSHVFPEAFQALGWDSSIDSLAIAREGWVNLEDIRLKYQCMMQLYRDGNERYLLHIWHLWMVFGIEAWYRAMFLNGGVTAEPGERLAAQCV